MENEEKITCACNKSKNIFNCACKNAVKAVDFENSSSDTEENITNDAEIEHILASMKLDLNTDLETVIPNTTDAEGMNSDKFSALECASVRKNLKRAKIVNDLLIEAKNQEHYKLQRRLQYLIELLKQPTFQSDCELQRRLEYLIDLLKKRSNKTDK